MFSTSRLETRTKEFELLASEWAVWKLIRAMKVNSLQEMHLNVVMALEQCPATTDGLVNEHLVDSERVAQDPKDGDLCLGRAKPRETMVEARSDSDVQIDRLIRV